MDYSLIKLLTLATDLLNNGKEDEAWEIITKWEKSKHLTREESYKYKIFKSVILFLTGSLQESLKITEEFYQDSVNQNNKLNALDAFIIKWCNLYLLMQLNPNIWEEILSFENFLKEYSDQSQPEMQFRRAYLYYFKGYHLRGINDFDNALDYLNKSLRIFKQIDEFFYGIPYILSALGMVYTSKGELDLALKANNESLNLSRGNYMLINIVRATSYKNLGDISLQKGDLSQAIEYYEKSMKLWEQHQSVMEIIWVGWIYFELVKTSILISSDKAQEYLDNYKEYLTRRKLDVSNNGFYKLSEAKILKSSTRIRNRAKAEKILTELSLLHAGQQNEFAKDLMIEICDFYIGELQLTHDLEVLNDIEPFIEKLVKESERSNSYITLAHTYLLQGQLALLQMNLGDARKHLTKAQRIAEDNGLQILARTISTEHDKLLRQFEEWENLKNQSSISERLNLSSLNVTMDRMQGARALNPPELVEEEPILLLIMGEDGISYFTHTFIEGWEDQGLFSSFMSAFNSFSSEFFSKSIDRIKIDENIILLKPAASFMVCYVIKGQSYPALLKLTRFTDAIKWKSEILVALNKAVKTSEMLELKNPRELGDVVNEIFK
ncbi:MAG: tetratricopeptide repeat protein [Promethearchaeota archaeon]|jgi:tetratricopeptide (TPR) repeat protein